MIARENKIPLNNLIKIKLAGSGFGSLEYLGRADVMLVMDAWAYLDFKENATSNL